jgi:hypothetical protein
MMIVTLKTQGLQTLEGNQAFLEGTQPLSVEAPTRAQAYQWVKHRAAPHRLPAPGQGGQGRYLCNVTGLSRAQMTRLITQLRDTGRIRDRRGPPAKPFARCYTPADVRLLAELDSLHGTLSGPATRKLCERAFELFGDERARLASISNGHPYHLRGARTYQRVRGHVDKTHPVKISIAERRKPHPQGRPGFLRVDSVHHGALDDIKGLYHINLIAELTQFQFVGSVEKLSVRFLVPLLEALIQAFPFHYINSAQNPAA